MVNHIVVLGLGYVGLPLTLELSKHFKVTGFDVSNLRVVNLLNGIDTNEEYSEEVLRNTSATFTSDSKCLQDSDFIIVTVPTPITNGNKPDLTPLQKASELIGRHLHENKYAVRAATSLSMLPNRPVAKPVVVFESTVYPGVTEEFCVPIIQEVSQMMYGRSWAAGYSPERVNPGDTVHTVSTITKVVSGMDEETLNIVDDVYSRITKTHRATSIKVAEAAKVIENSQRDLNIAFVNELALIFDKIGIDTLDVLEAAGTKWNFLPFRPGLVGGHCISVDPYYLTYKAEDAGVISQVILAGRHVNDSIPQHIVNLISRGLNNSGKPVNGSNILVLGATFKENCKDVRNSKVETIIRELKSLGGNVDVYDPFYNGQTIPYEHMKVAGISSPLYHASIADIVVVAVAHDEIRELVNNVTFECPVVDIKGIVPRNNTVIRL